jgi:S-adenosylmethionine hydrolase
MPGMVPLPREEADGIHAEVLWVDRFGNCQLNVGPGELAADESVWALTIGEERRAARIVTTFGELGAGSVGLVRDSYGMFKLALDQRSAAAELRLGPGDPVVLAPVDDDARGVTTPIALRRDR